MLHFELESAASASTTGYDLVVLLLAIGIFLRIVRSRIALLYASSLTFVSFVGGGCSENSSIEDYSIEHPVDDISSHNGFCGANREIALVYSESATDVASAKISCKVSVNQKADEVFIREVLINLKNEGFSQSVTAHWESNDNSCNPCELEFLPWPFYVTTSIADNVPIPSVEISFEFDLKETRLEGLQMHLNFSRFDKVALPLYLDTLELTPTIDLKR